MSKPEPTWIDVAAILVILWLAVNMVNHWY